RARAPWGKQSARLSRQLGADGGERLIGLVAVRSPALRHIGPAAAALPAERSDAGLNQVDRAETGGEIVGHADSEGCPAVVDRDDRRHTRTEPLLGFVEQAAQRLGLKTLQHLAREFDSGDLFI